MSSFSCTITGSKDIFPDISWEANVICWINTYVHYLFMSQLFRQQYLDTEVTHA